jgi:hypothetical protein
MAIREFSDSAGMLWRIWATVPSTSGIVSDDLRAGWLSFDSDSGRRRLAPVPKDWESANNERLELWLGAALPIRNSNPSGVAVPDFEGDAQ